MEWKENKLLQNNANEPDSAQPLYEAGDIDECDLVEACRAWKSTSHQT